VSVIRRKRVKKKGGEIERSCEKVVRENMKKSKIYIERGIVG
jgi:hypothetical protein